jgi:hypothetical protein
MRSALLRLGIICGTSLTLSVYAQPELKFREGSVWVTGLGSSSIEAEQWKEFLRVYTHEAFTKHINQPITGTYNWYGDSLSFIPGFSFGAGEEYHAVFGTIELAFSIPKKRQIPTRIESVHPQASVLPENTLRMYISFSASMMPGEAYDHIKLLDENGTVVEKAFLIIDQELWDTERKRLTLLFDPGRVKQNLLSNLQMGAPLKAGQRYSLVIDSLWQDAHGNPLTAGFTKSFTVTQAERTKLSIADWKIQAPTAGTRDELLMHIDRPIDHALAMNSIVIMGEQGKVSGLATLTDSNIWCFTPDQPWEEGEFNLEVFPLLEDVSGNNFNNPFDIDLSKESRKNSNEFIKQSFSIRPLVK